MEIIIAILKKILTLIATKLALSENKKMKPNKKENHEIIMLYDETLENYTIEIKILYL